MAWGAQLIPKSDYQLRSVLLTDDMTDDRKED